MLAYLDHTTTLYLNLKGQRFTGHIVINDDSMFLYS